MQKYDSAPIIPMIPHQRRNGKGIRVGLQIVGIAGAACMHMHRKAQFLRQDKHMLEDCQIHVLKSELVALLCLRVRKMIPR